MDKAQAKKLANSIIDYFVKLTEFERRADIPLNIQDDDLVETDDLAHTRIIVSHGYCPITVYVFPHTKEDEFIRSLLHELAHVFTKEMYIFYQNFVDDDEEETNARKVFMQDFERIAERYKTIMYQLWKLHTEGRK